MAEGTTTTDPTKVIQQILAGRFDGKALVDIVEAVQKRLLSGQEATRWVVDGFPAERFRDNGEEPYRWVEDDLTIRGAELVEKQTGLTWGAINPYSSAREARAIVTVLLRDVEGLSEKDALLLVDKHSMNEIVECLSQEAADPPTKPDPDESGEQPDPDETETPADS